MSAMTTTSAHVSSDRKGRRVSHCMCVCPSRFDWLFICEWTNFEERGWSCGGCVRATHVICFTALLTNPRYSDSRLAKRAVVRITTAYRTEGQQWKRILASRKDLDPYCCFSLLRVRNDRSIRNHSYEFDRVRR